MKKIYRHPSIDAFRGLIMVIMALDHIREGFGEVPYSPINLQYTSVALFFTRWITHFCAPLFILLAGVSILLYQSKQNNRKTVSYFLFSRGAWLIFVEIVLVSFIWLEPATIFLQILWLIGLSMILMGFIIWLPNWLKLILSISIIVLFPLLKALPVANHLFSKIISFILYQPGTNILLKLSSSISLRINFYYTLLPGLGVMVLGYLLGELYLKEAIIRRTIFLIVGISFILLFILLRYFNFYGDPYHWSIQSRGIIFTILSFIQITKYPFSLQYLLVVLGFGLLVLSFFEKIKEKNRVIQVLIHFGRVPFFFYLAHLYLAAGFAILILHFGYHLPIGSWLHFSDPGIMKLYPKYHYSLIRIYIGWLVLLLIAYPMCLWYGRFKKSHSQYKILSLL